MHSTDHHQPRPGNLYSEEPAFAGVLNEAALARSQRRFERLGEWIDADRFRGDEALRAVGEWVASAPARRSRCAVFIASRISRRISRPARRRS